MSPLNLADPVQKFGLVFIKKNNFGVFYAELESSRTELKSYINLILINDWPYPSMEASRELFQERRSSWGKDFLQFFEEIFRFIRGQDILIEPGKI